MRSGKEGTSFISTLFHSGFWDFFSNFHCLVTGIYLIGYPLYGLIWLTKDFTRLSTAHYHGKYEVLLLDIRERSLSSAYFNILYMLRRLIMLAAIICIQVWPLMQITVQIYLSLANLCYIISVKPYKIKSQYKIEVLNESMLYNSIMMCLLYEIKLNDNPYNGKVLCGQIHIFFTSVNVLICLISLVKNFPDTLKHVYLSRQ